MVIFFRWGFYTWGGEYGNENIELYGNYGMFCFGFFTTTPCVKSDISLGLRRYFGKSSVSDVVPSEMSWKIFRNTGEFIRLYLPAPLI